MKTLQKITMNNTNVKQEPETCWAYHDCPIDIRTHCNAHRFQTGDACWVHYDLRVGGPNNQDPGGCYTCPWFLKQTQNLNIE